MAKNIIVFSDGTNQEGGVGNDTNVYKTYRRLENRTSRQITFYDRGVGTGWPRITGNIGGLGLSENIIECYRFIFDHFEADDQVFLFGFSRGATTVRSLSSFIHLFGILPKSRPELIRRAYKIYKISNRSERDERAAEFVRRHPNIWCRIAFLGAWDTVAALGLPFKPLDVLIDRVPFLRHGFQDLRLSDSVTHARHALAIDDERLVFHPKLWDRELRDYQTMKQVWFCGMHTDVGGGYPTQQLSDVPLLWMIDQAKEHGLLIYQGHNVGTQPDSNGKMHDSRTGSGRFYRKRVRSWDSAKHGKPTVHQSVLLRTRNRKNEPDPPYDPWILKMDHEVEP